LRAPDREGEGEGNGRQRKTTKRNQIRTAAAEFIFSRNDCVYEIVIGFDFRPLFTYPRLVPIAIHY
jgi:hypothetical protein